jgi:hypothetical protein
MTDVYVVLIQDRHADPDVEVFADPVDAIEYAEKEVRDGARGNIDDIEYYEITDSMRRDGCLMFATYSCEGDSVRVTKHQVSE